jgi:4-hydroxy-3-polyprenylbenzoate decarboxylase
MPPERRAQRNYVNSRAIILAVRPFAWRDKFPLATRASADLRRRVLDKYRDRLGIEALG